VLHLDITPMTAAHLDQVLFIERNSFVSTSWSRESFYAEITQNKYAYYIVARFKESTMIIGYGGIWIVLDEAHITTLAVHPCHRRAGTGTIILNNLLEKAFLKGAGKIFLEVRVSNQNARKLYEKFNFKVVALRKNYYFDEDALVMMLEAGNLRSAEGRSALGDT
jgi:ribosomal-protein-alanine N-acetyltransferase